MTMTPTPPAESPPTLLLTARDVAAQLGISARHWFRLVDAGRAPEPVRLGAAVRWQRQAIVEWLAAGCPSCRVTGR
jgi:predicted DNA-binding transcriptional regulator AlpA